MVPGTNYKLKINLPMDSLAISDVSIIVSQNGRKKIIKEKKDCKFGKKSVVTELYPNETIRLDSYYKYAEIQAYGKTNTGKEFAFDVERIAVKERLA